MRRFGVIAVVAATLGMVAATTGFTPSHLQLTCAKGSVRAVIGGEQSCLKVGQRCNKRLDRQYHRYRFHCHTGRLTRALKPVPLTPVTITLQSVEGSGVSGTATLTPLDASTTRVTLEVTNPPPGDLPAHIHFDTCKNPSAIRYSLSNVVAGKSETTLSAAISYLRRGHGAFSINVHRAEPDLPIIACGDIPPA